MRVARWDDAVRRVAACGHRRGAGALLALVIGPAVALAQAPAPAPPTIAKQVETAYEWGDFADLERLYAQHARPGLRSTLTGRPQVEQFWIGINWVNRDAADVGDPFYRQLDLLTQRWVRDHPKSLLAHLLHATALRMRAWEFRGQGFANSVPKAAWVEFEKHLERAHAQLRAAEPLAAKDSSWNLQMLYVGRGLGWSLDRMSALFEDGIAKDPDHDDLYFAMQQVLLPKWGGDIHLVERFIERVTRDTRATRGLEMYARLYAALSDDEVKHGLFTSTRVSWPDMKAGFEDRLRKYPKANHRNKFAYFACMADDKATLREQLDLIGEGFDPDFWGPSPQRTYDLCKKLAGQT